MGTQHPSHYAHQNDGQLLPIPSCPSHPSITHTPSHHSHHFDEQILPIPSHPSRPICTSCPLTSKVLSSIMECKILMTIFVQLSNNMSINNLKEGHIC